MGPLPTIDLNADLGEGFGRWRLTDDEAAARRRHQRQRGLRLPRRRPGHHAAGVRAAAARGVAIGAQVSYRDLAGFGRRAMDVPPAELTAEVAYQIGALEVFARAPGTRVRYVKPHGALYNASCTTRSRPRRWSTACAADDPRCRCSGCPARRFLELAEAAGLPTVREAFADRAYTAAGTLVPRGEPGRWCTTRTRWPNGRCAWPPDGTVAALDGTRVEVARRSLCVHGDTPGAVELARRVRRALEASGVAVEAFA